MCTNPGSALWALVRVCTYMLPATHSQHAHSHTHSHPHPTQLDGGTHSSSPGKLVTAPLQAAVARSLEASLKQRAGRGGPGAFPVKDSRRHSWATPQLHLPCLLFRETLEVQAPRTSLGRRQKMKKWDRMVRRERERKNEGVRREKKTEKRPRAGEGEERRERRAGGGWRGRGGGGRKRGASGGASRPHPQAPGSQHVVLP